MYIPEALIALSMPDVMYANVPPLLFTTSQDQLPVNISGHPVNLTRP